jgi:DNA-binding transcriptional ArsR family regulator
MLNQVVNNFLMTTSIDFSTEYQASTQEDDQLDLIFKALSDRTRRQLLAELSKGDATVGQLAEPLDMSLPAASKHIKVLENASLVQRTKEGRVQTCTLQSAPMAKADAWLNHYRGYWHEQLDALEAFLETDASSLTPPNTED